MSVTTVPELPLPCQPHLGLWLIFLLHTAMSGQSILNSSGSRCASSIAIVVTLWTQIFRCMTVSTYRDILITGKVSCHELGEM